VRAPALPCAGTLTRARADVAIDGWALTLLSPRNVSYASAAQLAGLNTGFYLSYPILMALSSPTFRCAAPLGPKRGACADAEDSQKWGVPMLSLTWYLRFWAAVCFAVAAGLLLFKTEVRVQV
jgi:PAT family acetyl-CoA transporter-like MFS transporter 1